MTILVVGATGLLGRATALALLKDGKRVRAMVRDRTRATDLAQAGAEIVDGDLTDPASLELACKEALRVFAAATPDFQFVTAAAGFGLLLRDSQYKGNLTYGAVLEMAQSAVGQDKDGYRAEFVELVRKAKELRNE